MSAPAAINVKRAAQLADLPPTTVLEAIRKEQLPAKRIGKHYVIGLRTFATWLGVQYEDAVAMVEHVA